MKKIISLLLTFIMVFACMAPVCTAMAAEATDATPIIYVRGNGQKIYNADGEEVICDIGDFKLDGEGEDMKGKIVESCVNILLPFFAEGFIKAQKKAFTFLHLMQEGKMTVRHAGMWQSL